MLPNLSGEFRVVADPELRFTPSGVAVANVRLVANSRKKEGDTWVDDKVLWINGSAWDKMAENIAESVSQGDLVLVQGQIQTREWTDKDDNKRTTIDLIIREIGPSLRFATARPVKAERVKPAESGPTEDPWAGPPPTDEPPF
jgi:single-strand DNA-binding protein